MADAGTTKIRISFASKSGPMEGSTAAADHPGYFTGLIGLIDFAESSMAMTAIFNKTTINIIN